MEVLQQRDNINNKHQSTANIENGEDTRVDDFNGNLPRSTTDSVLFDSSRSNRIIKKAKRPSKQLMRSDSDPEGQTLNSVGNRAPAPFSKNSRKSRNGRGRGLPKKGGAGGKGVWGTPGIEMFEDGQCRDHADPNYDSESEDEYVVESIEPPVTDGELKKVVEPLLLEYFENGDSREVEENLQGLNLGQLKPKVTELAINLALDRKAMHRELTSQLISDLYGNTLHPKDISRAFDNVLTSLSDLTIDTPEAPVVVGQFIARAVADDCLPPKFVLSYKGKVDCPHASQALDKADVLLKMKHGIVRLDNVWGTGGGIRPVKFLIKQMKLLLKEFLSSGDLEEAGRCLRELEVPHFHHELVYEAVVMVIEDSSDRVANMMSKLLKNFCDSVLITVDQMAQGMRRVFEEMPEISIDVPAAYVLLEKFCGMLQKENVLTNGLMKELPQRGRKRFVSEGDGGRIKESSY